MNSSPSATHLTICTFATREGVPCSVAFEHLTGSFIVSVGGELTRVPARGVTGRKRLAATLRQPIRAGRAVEESFFWSHTGTRGDVCCRRIERELARAHGLI